MAENKPTTLTNYDRYLDANIRARVEVSVGNYGAMQAPQQVSGQPRNTEERLHVLFGLSDAKDNEIKSRADVAKRVSDMMAEVSQ